MKIEKLNVIEIVRIRKLLEENKKKHQEYLDTKAGYNAKHKPIKDKYGVDLVNYAKIEIQEINNILSKLQA